MSGRWSDERERYERERGERYDDRYDVFGTRDGRDGDRDREERSFGRGDRVFGERDSGMGYNRPPASRGADWQDPDYAGVSPAMQRGDYEAGHRPHPRFQSQDYTRGGSRSYGEDYGYGAGPRRYDSEGRRFGSAEADQRWAREMRRPAAGGTGGYDYERGYGDGGRYEGRDQGGDFEDRAREAGDFFRRTGRRISNWFSDVAGESNFDRGYGEDRAETYRGARGLGPKGYKRSDDRISDDAHQRLTDDLWLDATQIDLTVSGGELTLTGTVDSREAKHRAERLVEDLSGVTHVQNNLRVRTSGATYAGNGQQAGMRTEGDAAMQTSANARNKT